MFEQSVRSGNVIPPPHPHQPRTMCMKFLFLLELVLVNLEIWLCINIQGTDDSKTKQESLLFFPGRVNRLLSGKRKIVSFSDFLESSLSSSLLLQEGL